MLSIKKKSTATGIRYAVTIIRPRLRWTPHMAHSFFPKDQATKVSMVPTRPIETAKIKTLRSMFPSPTPASKGLDTCPIYRILRS